MKKFNLSKICGVFALLFIINTAVVAQPGCPEVNAGPDQNLPCGTTCTNLTAIPFQVGNTTSYKVSQIPYTPFAYNTGTTVLNSVDDQWSPTINIPFTFCYFGNPFTQCLLGSNEQLTFNLSNGGLFSTDNWNIQPLNPGGLPSNYYTDLANTIFCPWQDIDPSNQGKIYYNVIGTAPCRIFVASWYRIPYFGDPNSNSSSTCSQATFATSQVALYETTNVIEIYIQKKDTLCDDLSGSDWNEDLAVEGIEDGTGTVAYTVPGRNATRFAVHNDAWRFTPNGPSIVTVSWYQGATQISTDSFVTVCPTQQSTTYTAKAIYTPCNGGTPVTVTDDVVVTLAGSLLAGIDSVKNITCHGLNDGKAYAHASTANPPLSYGWSNGASTFAITNLSPGTYIFTATDASGCNIHDTVTITDPAAIAVTVPNVNTANCLGTGTGSLPSIVTGGTTPYSYSWSYNGETTATLTNAPANTYSVTVTDSTHCSASGSGTLTITVGSSTIVAGTPVVTNVSCNGLSDGSIIGVFTGASAPVTYLWNNNQTSDTATGLAAGGPYAVTITDAGGCTASSSASVTQPAPLTLAPATIQNIGCNGAATGSITANPTGGTPTYTYHWVQQSNSQVYSGQTISNLGVDTYGLVVTDANSCSVTAAYQITASPALTFTTSSTNVSCNAGSDGTATVTITGGTPPYQYNWNGAGNTATGTITGLSAGTTNVTITDADCSATATFNIIEPTVVVVNLVSQAPVLCNGGSNGSVTVSASGGSGSGYSFSWSDGQTGPTDSVLPAGSITVTATDANGCTGSQTYNTTAATVLGLVLTEVDARCFNAPDGQAMATPSGGTPPYQYLWSDGNNEQTVDTLTAGTYSVTVTDANSCKVNQQVTVGQPAADLIISATTTAVKCIGDKNGTITPSAVGGTPPYNFSASQDGSNFVFTTDNVIIGLDTGTYNVYASDLQGCTKIITAYVPNATPNAFITSTDSTLCYGPEYNDGAAHISDISVQNEPYQYMIDGGALQDTGYFDGLSAGAHLIITVNANGCKDSVPVIVGEPLPIVVNIVPDTVILPLGESQAVMVNYLNASNPTYMWSPPVGLSCMDCPNPTANSYAPGDYIVTVSMVNGTATCTGSASLNVQVLGHKPFFIPNSFSPNGDGNNDVFLIYGESIKTVKLKIFNRWGILVFESENPYGGWDGTYRGLLQNPGVYTYEAEVTFLDDSSQKKNGSVTIVR